MNVSALKLTLGIVSLIAALASWCDAGLKAVVVAPQHAVSGEDVFLDSSDCTPADGILKRHWRISAVPPTALVPGRRQFDLTDPVKPRLLSFAGTYTIELTIVGTDGELDATEVVIEIRGGSDCPPPIPCPTPEPTPTPIPPAPPKPTPPTPVPTPPPLPVPNVQGKYGAGNQVAKIVQDIYRLRTAGKPASEHLAIYQKWASEVDQAAAITDDIADRVAAAKSDDAARRATAITNVMQIKPTMPAGLGWDVAGPALSKVVLDTYKDNASKLKLSLTGDIIATDEWNSFLKTEFSGGIRGAK